MCSPMTCASTEVPMDRFYPLQQGSMADLQLFSTDKLNYINHLGLTLPLAFCIMPAS
jgi:hypothetical protein